MFSIVIPLFNKSAYIEKAVQSVLEQSFTDFELIIVNDGSTDGGPAKVFGYSDPRIKMIDKENGGVSVARNRGISEAKYENVAFLDADDWWDKNFLQEMKVLLEEFPEAGIYGCNYYYVKNGKKRIDKKGLNYTFTSGYINYINAYSSSFSVPFNCSFVIVKKNIFMDVGEFKPELRFGEDFDLWIRIALKYKVAYLNKSLAYSNQDVEATQRSLGNANLLVPASHFIFNLSYLEEKEKRSSELKKLLDGLRVRALLPFYLEKISKEEVKNELSKVNFNDQPPYYKFIYKFPITSVRSYFYLKMLGSGVKQKLINYFSR